MRRSNAGCDGRCRSDSTRWIVNLHGAGGTGKTTILRRLVSHRLITRRLRIPCVRIDFDTVSLSAVCDFPWLLALPIAEQLDRQISEPLFTTLLARVQPFRALVGGRHLDAETELVLRERAHRGMYVWQSLLKCFQALPQDRPIVIIVDTLEEASLHRPEQLLTIVRRLSELHAVSRATRLVLAGRYALGLEHVPEFCDTFLSETRHIRLHRFRDATAGRFVKRLWPDVSDDRLHAIVKRGAGSPFRLALLVELAESDPSITAARIGGPEFDHVDEAYLMDRVIRRIPLRLDATAGDAALDQLPVRWVIRYGVVPRRLSLEFVAQVLLPFLQRALAGDAELAGDDFVEQYKADWPAFATPDRTFDVGRVWQQLASYATSGRHGWVSVDRGEEETLRFHPDVVTPMRRLLREKKVHAALQRAARDFFAARGAVEDVLFHELQLFPARALHTWRGVFDQCGDDWSARQMLADGLLGPDFAAAPPAALSLAHWQAANAMCADVNYTFALPSLAFDRAWRHLGEAQRLERLAGEVIVPAWCRSCAEAMRLFRAGRSREAVELLDRELASGAYSDREQVRLLLQRAELRVRMGQDAEADFAQALDSARADESREVPLWAIHDRIAHRAARRGAWQIAGDHYAAALASAQESGRLHKVYELTNRLVALDLSEGRPSRAFTRLTGAERLGTAGQPRNPHYFESHARVALALLRPDVAIDFASLMQRTLAGHERSALEAAFVLGEAYAEQLELDRALEAYRRGRQAFAARGDLSSADRCRVAMLRLFVRYAGNVREAAMLLDEGPLASADQNPALRVEWAVLSAWVALRTGRPSEAAEILETLASPRATGQSRPQQIVAWLARLAFGLGALDRAQLTTLLLAIAEVVPVTARTALLHPLALGGVWSIAPDVDVTPLLGAFTIEAEPGRAEAHAVRESRIRAIATAELARALGRFDDAWAMLGPAEEVQSFGDLILLRHRLALEMRLREAGSPGPRLPAQVNLEAAARTPVLQAALRLGLAERLVAAEAFDEAGLLNAPTIDQLRHTTLATSFHLHAEAQTEVLRVQRTESASAPTVDSDAMLERMVRQLGYQIEGPGGAVGVTRTHVTIAGVRVRHRGTTWTVPPSAPAAGSEDTLPLLLAFDSTGPEPRVAVADESWLPLKSASLPRLASHEDHWREAEQLAEDWRVWAVRLASWLEPVRGRSAPAAIHDRRIWLDVRGDLSVLPWELAVRVPGAHAMSLVRVPWRLEGVPMPVRCDDIDPQPDASVETRRRDARAASEGPPHVLVIDAVRGTGAQRLAGVSFELMPHRLERAGAHVTVVPSLERGLDVLATTSPHLVIISAMLCEATEGYALLSGTCPVDASSLHDRLVRRAGRPPTLVLDIPSPGSPTEAVVQLLARNRIAFDVARRGQVHAVLGLGLGHEEAMGRSYDVLCEAVAQRLGLDEMLDRLAAAGATIGEAAPRLDAVLPFLAAALFTADPHALFLPA